VEIQQSFTVPYVIDQVWRCFQDIEGIVNCLPGAALSAPPDNGALKLSMTVKLGPIVAAFAGDGTMVLDNTLRCGVINGSGRDRKSGSRVKGEAAFSLHETGRATPETRVDVQVDYSIAGSLAQFSRGGIVRELAERLTLAFSDNLQKKLQAENLQAALEEADTTPASVEPTNAMQHVAAAAAAAPPPATPVPARTAPAPLDLGGLFWPMLLRRLKRLIGLSS
jgi:carbon monoxide dehydrogenase subunit G